LIFKAENGSRLQTPDSTLEITTPKVNGMSKGQDSKKAGKKQALLTPKEKKLAKKVKKDTKSKGVNNLN
jgi:hypothetical protein